MSEKWTDEAVVILLTQVQEGVSDSKIAELLSKHFNCTFTRDSVKNKRTRLQNNEGGKDFGTTLEKYLTRGRTEREIKQRFGDVMDRVVAPPKGLTLFKQRNEFNEEIFVWLPITSPEVNIIKRSWDLRIAEDGDPYMWAQFHDNTKEIRIVPLFDAHYGHVGHRHEKFLSYIRWIAETEGIYVILGGDDMENALDDGRGYSYDQEFHPEKQMTDMVKFLAPIAHRILCMTPGNHEQRTKNRSGIDPTMYIADMLNVPYFTGPIILDALWKGYRWGYHIFHGRGNSQTKGGKHNAAARPVRFTDNINFYISGHTHDPMVNTETRLVRDPVNCRLLEQSYWVIVAQSFLRWKGTYAYIAGYAPPGKGGVSTILYPNGEYKADFST